VAGAAGAPVGTKAGPGEVFDAEAFGRSKGPGAGAGAGVGAPMPVPKRQHWWNRRRTWVIAGVALALVLLAAGLAVAFGTNAFTPSHPTPTLANMTVAEARTTLEKVHMTLAEGTPVKSITVGSGDIVSQNPKAGVSVKEGTTVTVVVSDGPPNVTVPSLSGMTCAQASTALTAAHFKSVCAPGAYNNNVQAGVLDIWTLGSTQNPTKAPYGATITLVPSLGHEPATVPNIPTSYSFAQAQAALQAVGLTATQNPQSSTTVPNGQVISTSPASGQQAPYGSAVTVNVSTGPPTTTVPDVKGDSVQQADAALQQAGLTPSGVSGNPSNNVIGTQPSIGSTVPTGSAVQLFTH
jgi:serine/threonine-protein kinase